MEAPPMSQADAPPKAKSRLPSWLEPYGHLRGLGGLIDYTLLRADATEDEIVGLCDSARRLGAATVCVNGFWAPLCAHRLAGSSIGVVAVVGFPLGAVTTMIKAAEARLAVLDGVAEIDMVMAVGLAK